MPPAPRTTSQYDPKEAHRYSAACRCLQCFEERTDRLIYPARPVMRLPVRTWVLIGVMGVAMLTAGVLAAKAVAREGGRPPQAHPCATVKQCRAAVRWQRKARRDDARRTRGYGVDHAIRLAAALYGVPLAEMRSVANCESHTQATSHNQTSSASGLFQFLDSTWTRAGVPGFSVFDPYASALAAARLVTIDHGWHEWSCKP